MLSPIQSVSVELFHKYNGRPLPLRLDDYNNRHDALLPSPNPPLTLFSKINKKINFYRKKFYFEISTLRYKPFFYKFMRIFGETSIKISSKFSLIYLLDQFTYLNFNKHFLVNTLKEKRLFNIGKIKLCK